MMKRAFSDLKVFLFVIATAVMFLAVQGLACGGSPSECEFIKDSDKRSYCRAIANHRASHCTLIKDDDLRHMCLALADTK